MTSDPAWFSRLAIAAAGLLGAIGVMAAAGATHFGDTRVLGSLALIALSQAPAVLVLALHRRPSLVDARRHRAHRPRRADLLGRSHRAPSDGREPPADHRADRRQRHDPRLADAHPGGLPRPTVGVFVARMKRKRIPGPKRLIRV